MGTNYQYLALSALWHYFLSHILFYFNQCLHLTMYSFLDCSIRCFDAGLNDNNKGLGDEVRQYDSMGRVYAIAFSQKGKTL